MEWVGCILCDKFQNDFMARTSTLIAPVQLVLQRVSYSYETLPNAPKHYETHQNMSFGSNGVHWVRSLRNILMRLHGTNFCINCTSSTRFAPSFVYYETLPNAPKYYETHQNMSLGSYGVDQVHLLRKSLMRLHGTNFCINCTCSTRLRLVSCSNETLPNAPKHYQTHQN